MQDEQVVMKIPEWVKEIKSDNVAGAVVGLMFAWTWDDKKVKGDNLREFVASRFDDLSEDEAAEVADLLIEHGVVK